MSIETPVCIEVNTSGSEKRHELFNAAETRLRQSAMINRASGILVTRHDANRYTFELSSAVPFGVTRERTLF